MQHFKWLFAAAALGLATAPAAAAPIAPDKNAAGTALILIPLQLTKIDDLEFGTVVSSSTSGTVTIDATTGARSVTGGVTPVASDVGQRAYFGGGGTGGQTVVITVTNPLLLTSATGDLVDVLALTLDGPPTRTIHPVDRTFFFGVGGIIEIDANQPEGIYQSAFDVTVDYY